MLGNIINIKLSFGAGAGWWGDGVSCCADRWLLPFVFSVVPTEMALAALGGGCPLAGWGPPLYLAPVSFQF